MRVCVVGGGAAGFFAALICRETNPDAHVTILEASSEVLRKVSLSGGGRCNLTNATFDPRQLAACYPRGGKALIGPFSRFGPRETMEWFARHGVALRVEEQRRVFPVAGGSGAVVGCLTAEAQRLGITLVRNCRVRRVSRRAGEGGFVVAGEERELGVWDRVVIAAGGGATDAYACAESLGHTIEPPIPSLYGLRTGQRALTELAGVAVDDVILSLAGTKARARGSLLFTHEGVSGPAILTLSSWAARDLHDADFFGRLYVDWCPKTSHDEARCSFEEHRRNSAREDICSRPPAGLPRRLWRVLAFSAGCPRGLQWANLSARTARTLVESLKRFVVAVDGRAAHSGEFVTCGGVRLDEVNMRTMESRRCPGLFLAGEILDIDGLTGGYNLQAAWTSGATAGRCLCQSGSDPT